MKNVKQGTAHFLELSYFKDYIKTGYVKQGSPVQVHNSDLNYYHSYLSIYTYNVGHLL